jgi:Mg/Co/Ni transporter MgtE
MLTNLSAGASGGILIRQLLNRFRIDFAMCSGTFVTTVTDVAGHGSFLVSRRCGLGRSRSDYVSGGATFCAVRCTVKLGMA